MKRIEWMDIDRFNIIISKGIKCGLIRVDISGENAPLRVEYDDGQPEPSEQHDLSLEKLSNRINGLHDSTIESVMELHVKIDEQDVRISALEKPPLITADHSALVDVQRRLDEVERIFNRPDPLQCKVEALEKRLNITQNAHDQLLASVNLKSTSIEQRLGTLEERMRDTVDVASSLHNRIHGLEVKPQPDQPSSYRARLENLEKNVASILHGTARPQPAQSGKVVVVWNGRQYVPYHEGTIMKEDGQVVPSINLTCGNNFIRLKELGAKEESK